MATRRECVHVRRVPHMRCVMRATAVRACACVVTLNLLRSVRYPLCRSRHCWNSALEIYVSKEATIVSGITRTDYLILSV